MTVSHQGFVVGDGEHAGYCDAPGHHPSKPRGFVGRAPDMDRCHDCWYAEEMAAAAGRWPQLTGHFDRAGVPWSIDQTGGMVMCLRIDMPGRGQPDETWWIWVSELDELIGEGELWVGVLHSGQEEESDSDIRSFAYLTYNDEGQPEIDDTTWANFADFIIAITKEDR